MGKIRIGFRFFHARILDSMRFDGKSAQLFQVSAIRRGMVYYKPVYNYGEREELGTTSDCCPIEQFHKHVKSEPCWKGGR